MYIVYQVVLVNGPSFPFMTGFQDSVSPWLLVTRRSCVGWMVVSVVVCTPSCPFATLTSGVGPLLASSTLAGSSRSALRDPPALLRAASAWSGALCSLLPPGKMSSSDDVPEYASASCFFLHSLSFFHF